MEVPLRITEAISYLENKYHESFELYSATTIGLDQPYAELFFRSSAHPHVFIRVYDDYRTFSDDYFGALIQDQLQHLMDKAAAQLPCDAKIFFRLKAHSFRDELRDPSTFPQVLAEHPGYFISNIFAFLTAVDNTTGEALNGYLQAENIHGTLMVYQADAETLSLISADTYNRFLTDHNSMRPVYSARIP